MRELTALYAEKGQDAVPAAIKYQAPDEVIEQVIGLIKQNLGE